VYDDGYSLMEVAYENGTAGLSTIDLMNPEIDVQKTVIGESNRAYFDDIFARTGQDLANGYGVENPLGDPFVDEDNALTHAGKREYYDVFKYDYPSGARLEVLVNNTNRQMGFNLIIPGNDDGYRKQMKAYLVETFPRYIARNFGNTNRGILELKQRFEKESFQNMVTVTFLPDQLHVSWRRVAIISTYNPEQYVNKMGMRFQLVKFGTFSMGTNQNIRGIQPLEKPKHPVMISEPFYLGQFEVTQQQWFDIMGTTVRQQWEQAKKSQPGLKTGVMGEGPDHPIYYVSWEEANEFCRRMSEKYKAVYRLPTEAEWEYAASCGRTVTMSTSTTGQYSWYAANSSSRHSAVGKKKPNKWGFHDMTGNVSEYCSDWLAPYEASAMPVVDPQGPASGKYKILRGGSIFSSAVDTRYTRRVTIPPDQRSNISGFRIVLETPNELQRLLKDWDSEK
jgi:formylglycine-generating enzyme required for sulfatase activity